MTEIWLPIKELAGAYEVSDLGRVRSLTRTIVQANGKVRTFEGRVKAPGDNGRGYKAVSLFSESRTVRRYVHRLVAEAFLPNPQGLPEVNHKSGDKSDNSLSNLEWVSRSDNCIHARAEKLYEQAKGEACGNAKLSEQDVLQIRELAKKGEKHADIAALFGVGRKAITKIVNRQRWKHI